jgi:hypothetical protein
MLNMFDSNNTYIHSILPMHIMQNKANSQINLQQGSILNKASSDRESTCLKQTLGLINLYINSKTQMDDTKIESENFISTNEYLNKRRIKSIVSRFFKINSNIKITETSIDLTFDGNRKHTLIKLMTCDVRKDQSIMKSLFTKTYSILSYNHIYLLTEFENQTILSNPMDDKSGFIEVDCTKWFNNKDINYIKYVSSILQPYIECISIKLHSYEQPINIIQIRMSTYDCNKMAQSLNYSSIYELFQETCNLNNINFINDMNNITNINFVNCENLEKISNDLMKKYIIFESNIPKEYNANVTSNYICNKVNDAIKNEEKIQIQYYELDEKLRRDNIYVNSKVISNEKDSGLNTLELIGASVDPLYVRQHVGSEPIKEISNIKKSIGYKNVQYPAIQLNDKFIAPQCILIFKSKNNIIYYGLINYKTFDSINMKQKQKINLHKLEKNNLNLARYRITDKRGCNSDIIIDNDINEFIIIDDIIINDKSILNQQCYIDNTENDLIKNVPQLYDSYMTKLSNIDWLWEYQKEDVVNSTIKKRHAITSEMGTGKTRQMIGVALLSNKKKSLFITKRGYIDQLVEEFNKVNVPIPTVISDLSHINNSSPIDVIAYEQLKSSIYNTDKYIQKFAEQNNIIDILEFVNLTNKMNSASGAKKKAYLDDLNNMNIELEKKYSSKVLFYIINDLNHLIKSISKKTYAYLLKNKYSLIIMDEAHIATNSDNLITDAASSLRSTNKLLVTGTIIKKDHMDLFNTYNLYLKSYNTPDTGFTLPGRNIDSYMRCQVLSTHYFDLATSSINTNAFIIPNILKYKINSINKIITGRFSYLVNNNLFIERIQNQQDFINQIDEIIGNKKSIFSETDIE